MTAPVVIVGVNSWVTISQADDYLAGKFGASAWTTLTVLQKTQLLITACRWIRQQATLSIAMSITTDVVRNAQCEATWFVYSYGVDYEKRRALISSGVRTFKILDFGETLGEVAFPAFIADMLADYLADVSHQFPRMSRDLQDNASE